MQQHPLSKAFHACAAGDTIHHCEGKRHETAAFTRQPAQDAGNSTLGFGTTGCLHCSMASTAAGGTMASGHVVAVQH